MQTDIVTQSIASLGLVTQALTIGPTPDQDEPNELKPVFYCGEAWDDFDDPAYEKAANAKLADADYIQYMRSAQFNQVVDALADKIADLSINVPDAYAAIVNTIGDAGTAGIVVLRRNGAVPDAVKDNYPELMDEGYFSDAIRRSWPAAHVLMALSVQGPTDADTLDEFCQANPGKLVVVPDPADPNSFTWRGWNEDVQGIVSIPGAVVDFSKPWRIDMVGDTEFVRPAELLERVSKMLNLWQPIVKKDGT